MISSKMAVAAAAFLATAIWQSGEARAAEPVKMVVTAAFVSDRGLDVYEDIASYLTSKAGFKVEVVSGLSYAEADRALDAGKIAVGAVCGLPYVHKQKEGSMSLLAIPVVATKSGTWSDVPTGYENTPGKYYSYTIVRNDSTIKGWEDLKGKSYAINDVGSNSGYNMPRYKLVQLGAKSWEEYFGKIILSGSHEESIRLVAQGLVDASSVDSLVLDYDRSTDEPYSKQVKVIEQLFPSGAGAPPIVVSSKADPAIIKPLQDALLNMNKDDEGKKILERALLIRFDPPADANYDDIRKMETAAIEANFKDFSPPAK